MAPRAFITGLAGPTIAPDERVFLREATPWGLILFRRNIIDPVQIRALVDDFRMICARADAPVLIDQEGGRVQRLGPPHWPTYPYDPELGLAAAWLGARLIAADLAPLGITIDCLPLADVPVAGADPVIGDRAYGDTPQQVAASAAAVAAGLERGGVLPVVKHLPGHGRAAADSHERLPVVTTDRHTLEMTDFAAFTPLAGLPLGMTAHVLFTALDPDLPATVSSTIIDQVIRESIGFTGALMSDDVSMAALPGSIAERTRSSLAAGCDIVLHCNGNLAEMEEVASQCSEVCGAALERTARALARRGTPDDIDIGKARARFASILGGDAETGTLTP
jgi:beta-N-acetylhexosaminidase